MLLPGDQHNVRVIHNDREVESSMSTPRRKHIRLDRSAYAETSSSWLVTIACQDRAPVFADPMFGGACAAQLTDLAQSRKVGIPVYCFMLDHLHVLASVQEGNLVDFVRAYKSLSTRVWRGWNEPGPLWQRSFHDVGLRDVHGFERAITYVLENPVNAGLCADWSQYPLTGGSLVEGA